MAVQSPYLTIDGDLNLAKRKLSGERLADEVWPQATRSRSPLLPDPQDFSSPAEKRPQAGQPGGALEGIGASTTAAGTGIGSGAGRVLSPLINPLTPFDLLTAVPRDAVRNASISLAGGDPTTASGGATKYSDAAFGRIQPTIEAFQAGVGATGRRVSRSILDATGASPADPAAPSIAGSIADPQAGRASVEAAAGTEGASQRAGQPQGGIADPWYLTDSGIAARRGADGIAEFSNEKTVLDSAQAMPAGGVGGSSLLRPGVSNIADGVPLAQRGSINNVGNGIGTFSQGIAGDAANAIAQFDAANAIRREQLPGVRVAGTGYQNPITAGQAAAQGQQDRRDATRTDARLRDRGLAMQEQSAQREAEAASLDLAGRRRLDGLMSIMSDVGTSAEEREKALQTYTSLTTPAKDRWKGQDVILGRDDTGRDVRGTQLIDVTTGRPVVGIGDTTPAGLPRGVSKDQALSEAKAAVASGASKEAVNDRLRQWGLDPI